jgi:putative hydrolase of the HAD superfamily
MKEINVVAFDADDTLWDNEPYFRAVEEKFCNLMEDFLPRHSSSRELLKVEIENLSLYGYGIKAFVLSMVEASIRISEGNIKTIDINKILQLGKEMINQGVDILPDVEIVLAALQHKYRLVLATKGDLLDQQRKLVKSGLEKYFHHIEIMSEKNEIEYSRMLRHLDIEAHQFAMIGNSIKSDVLPVLNLGGYGFHIPYHVTWELEKVDVTIDHPHFFELTSIAEVLKYLGTEEKVR